MVETQSTHAGADLLAEAVGNWQLDIEQTSINLRTKSLWGLGRIQGSFKAVDGYGTVGRDGAVSGALIIDANSIDTRNGMRDMYLRNVFEVDRFPTLTYTATKLLLQHEDSVNVTGALTIKGHSRPTNFTADVTCPAPGTLILETETEINRRDWGFTWTKMGSAFVSRISIVAPFTRPWYAHSTV